LEDLKVQNLVCNHRLSKCILDSGRYLSRQRLTHKVGGSCVAWKLHG